MGFLIPTGITSRGGRPIRELAPIILNTGEDEIMVAPSVLVVGAGISGLACARALRRNGVDVQVADRGRRAGGRMSGRTLEGRAVDLGASYFTVEPDSGFASVVEDWVDRELARPWTDTFALAGPDGVTGRSTGPMRYAAPAGLRALVIDLGAGLPVEQQRDVGRVSHDGEVDGIRYDAVVLAMPDPQAKRMLEPDSGVYDRLQESDEWEPTISVALGWESRHWPDDLHAAFLKDAPAVGFVADDGDRRGDAAAVLVAHSTADFAREHLEEPDGAFDSMSAAVADILGIPEEPAWRFIQRWSFARPSSPHDEPFLLVDRIGVCGDAWGGKSSVGAAWTSGDALGLELAAELTGSPVPS